MPTPSSNNAPDPPSPRSPRPFPFSSCPDPDESAHQSHLSQSQTDQSPSSWRENLLSGAVQSPANDEASLSRSVTMSPGPQLDPNRDVDMGQRSEAVVTGGSDGEEDTQKNVDVEMTSVEINPMQRDRTRGSNLQNSRTGAVVRTSTFDVATQRGKQQADITSTTYDSDEEDMWDLMGNSMRWVEDSGLAGLGYEYSQTRIIPTSPSSFLRPGSRFTGTQQSERQRYDVQVEIKHVDLRESFLCGYLKIQGTLLVFSHPFSYPILTGTGLTDDHPTLTTYFEGEIIGPKYGFTTQHPSWGATDKIDLSHWAKFPAFRPYQKQAKKNGNAAVDMTGRDSLFMRWKEHFLVPNHRVRTINGASFEGFYYICFNQVHGEVSGIYFHSRSEK